MQASWILLFVAFFDKSLKYLRASTLIISWKGKKESHTKNVRLGYIHVWGYGYCDWWRLVELHNWWMVLLMAGWSQDIHGLIDDSLSTSFMKNRLDYWERNWFLGWWVTDIIIWPSLHGLKFETVLANYFSSKKISHIQFSNCIWRTESFDILFTLVPY